MSERVNRYYLVSADSETALIDEVNRMIKYDQMQPLGGPAVFTGTDGKPAILQAMVSIQDAPGKATA
ncbi:MAG: hypothetical protein ABR976_13520 [Terracidiphilus sp.]|jgi:hypothetical protein